MADLNGNKLSMVERLASSSSSNLLRSVYIRRAARSERKRQKLATWSLLILSMSLFVPVSEVDDNKQNIMCPLMNMNFMFSCSTRHPTSEHSYNILFII